MKKVKEAIILLSKANDNLIMDIKKVNEVNASLNDRYIDLEKRCNQLSLHQALSDMLTYLINRLNLLSYSIRTSGLSFSKLCECLENSVTNLGTDNDIDVSLAISNIVNNLPTLNLPEAKSTKDKDQSTNLCWKYIIELLRRLFVWRHFKT